MALSHLDIQRGLDSGEITIDPIFPDSMQPASVDLHLGKDFLIFKPSSHPILDLTQPIEMERIQITPDQPFTLHVGQFALAQTFETVGVGAKHRAQVEGKSSLGRVGLIVHVTAGYIDPGFNGPITLELVNHSGRPINLHYGMPIGQVAFDELSSPAENLYGTSALGSKYGNAKGVQASMYYKNFQPPHNGWMEFIKKYPDQ